MWNSTFGNISERGDVSVASYTLAVVKLLFVPVIIGGNFLVLASVCVFQRLRTSTNYFLLSLAISDLLVGLLTIPLYAAFYLQAGSLMHNRVACLAWFGSVILGCGSSLFNLLLIVLDRFMAIHFPFRYGELRTPCRVVSALTGLWVYVVILSCLPLMGWNHWDDASKCSFYSTLPKAYVAWSAYLTVGICILVSSLLYGKIFLTVHQHRKKIQALNVASSRENQWMQREVRSTRLSATVFLLFVLFWAPYFLVGPLKYTSLSQEVVEIIKNTTLVLAFGNSMVNPVVYGLARKDFRTAYKVLVVTPITQWGGLRNVPLQGEDAREMVERGACTTAQTAAH
ncbi:hypothetical protein BaRGS_00026541 [Batillaria attramentaria]|uniref:G-protein coupled receptors family 1 profile domain-containing protein n=1 Tax=Batillaria attramentaria TaxID=370345 RepID=A0ABD0K5T4_9CAEN